MKKNLFTKPVICLLLLVFALPMLLFACKKNPPLSIEVDSLPTKTQYIVRAGEPLDLSGGTLKVVYGDDDVRYLSMTHKDVTYSGFDTGIIGKLTITISYMGVSTTLDVYVVSAPLKVESITVISLPSKTRYLVGDTLDARGGRIAVTYSDSNTIHLNLTAENVTLSALDSLTTGKKTIVVTLENKSDSFEVKVIEPELYELLDLFDEASDAPEDLIFLAYHRVINIKTAALSPAQSAELAAWDFDGKTYATVAAENAQRALEISDTIPNNEQNPQLFSAYEKLLEILTKKITDSAFVAGNAAFDAEIATLNSIFFSLPEPQHIEFFNGAYSILISEYASFYLSGQNLDVFSLLQSAVISYYQCMEISDMTVFTNKISKFYLEYIKLDDKSDFDSATAEISTFYLDKLYAITPYEGKLSEPLNAMTTAYLHMRQDNLELFAPSYLSVLELLGITPPVQSLLPSSQASRTLTSNNLYNLDSSNLYNLDSNNLYDYDSNNLYNLDSNNLYNNDSENIAYVQAIPSFLDDYGEFIYRFIDFEIYEGETLILTTTMQNLMEILTDYYQTAYDID